MTHALHIGSSPGTPPSTHTKMISKLSTYLNRSSRVARDATARGQYSKPDMAENTHSNYKINTLA
jgi:hypothetical protein